MDKQAKVLFVEDSKNEFHLTQMILRREKFNIDMHYVRDGLVALDFLKHKNKYSDIGFMPDLIFLDKRLITMDGDELLKIIKKDKSLKHIPVVMFSGEVMSGDQEDFISLGALGVYEKPVNSDIVSDVVSKVADLCIKEESGIKYLCVS